MELKKLIRNYFRVAIDDPSIISLLANGHSYSIVDVGDRGVGIRLTAEDIFLSVHDELDIELKINGIIHAVQGKIVHISPDDTGGFLCGIELIKLDETTRKNIIELLQSFRKVLFN